MRYLFLLGQITILFSIAILAQDQPSPAEKPKSMFSGCVLKHIIYDERPTDVWLAYATLDGKEIQLLSRRNDLMKAAKDCKTYLKEQKEKDASNKKSKDQGIKDH